MASLANTYTLFGFTSPRTLEKSIPEIRLLIQEFAGQRWRGSKSTQVAFFERLLASDFYQDSRPTAAFDFAARDRITRSPKAYGFVSLEPVITLTAAGEALLAGDKTPEIFTRQLMKFQLPSPYHTAPPNEPERFAIRPHLELLRLVRDTGSLSQTEIEVFFLPLTRWTDYDDTLRALRDFRERKSQIESTLRAAFVEEYADAVTRRVYQADIAANRFGTRQGRTETEAEFIAKKRQTAGDYSDAFMRHLRATQLVTVDPRTFHLIVSAQRREEVDYLLNTIPRAPVDLTTYKAYLESPTTPRLLQDDEIHLQSRLATLHVTVPAKASVADLQRLLALAQLQRQQASAETMKQQLQHFGKFEEVEEFFERLSIRRPAVPDASLWFEWNVWRSMVMLNYARAIQGNFVSDLDGLPVHFAPGNRPDLEADYNSFRLIVEVTRSSGHKQYEMEGEPVARHYGDAQQAAPAGVPVYCLFIAPTINDSSLAHYFTTNRTTIRRYGGKTKIIPLTLAQFRTILARGKARGFASASQLQDLFDRILNAGCIADDELDWQQSIDSHVKTWLN